MKQAVLLIFLALAGSLHAQSLNLLTNLHPRPQVSYLMQSDRPTTINSKWYIAFDCHAATGTIQAIEYLQQKLKPLIGDTLSLVPFYCDSDLTTLPDSNFIVIGGKYDGVVFPYLQKLPIPDSLSQPEGYAINIDRNLILIAGADTNGTFDAISTLAQLISSSGNNIPSLHINDWPDYPIRWVFSLHNLIVGSQITALEAIEDTMAAHKLNGLQQNDFKNNIYSVFEGSYPPYFYNVDSLQAYSQKRNIELIPGMFPIGWSEGILFHDPDLAEGFPTTTSFLIQNDTGMPVGDPNVALPHGNFENATNGTFPGWNWYDPTVFVDSTTAHSGKYSARATNFTDTTPNGRFIKLLTCKPHEGYHMSAWYKTQNFQGEFNLLAIGFHGSDSRALTYTAFSVPTTTSGWQQANVVINTLDYDSMNVYCGVWSGQAGTIWMDDFQIEEAGLTNVLRRKSDIPLVAVRGKSSTYVEGKDYAMVVDSTMEKAQGTYPWHTSPSFTVLAGSAIHNGDTVDIHFIRPNPVNNDPTGDGSTMVCVSEDTLYPILHDQLKLVDSQYHAKRYFMSHDEIREMNWDSACQNRNTSPAVLLADNVRKCDSIIHEVHPGAEVFDWSDMFDSLHNAHNNYYLVNGDLTGDWKLIPKDFTIVNWNAGVPDNSKPEINLRKQSLNFFANLGFSQITSPYYDVQTTDNIRAWRDSMEGVPNIRGMMYTTWADDYSFLTPFADYAWSAGPMIVHEPPNLYETITNGEYVQINANIFSDPYDPTDSIVKATYTQYDRSGGVDQIMVYKMVPDTGHYYRCTNLTQGDPGTDVTYQIQATDLEGITRTTPKYTIFHVPGASVIATKTSTETSMYPNPASNFVTLRANDIISFEIVDALGRSVLSQALSDNNSMIDVRGLPIGTYNCIVRSRSGIESKNLSILR